MVRRPELSRRERQIMDALFARQTATVREICAAIPDPPTPMAMRRMLAILLEKGHVKRRKAARGFVYLPRQSPANAGWKALRHVLQTFFGGSLDAALAAHLHKSGADLTPEEIERLQKLVDNLSDKRRVS